MSPDHFFLYCSAFIFRYSLPLPLSSFADSAPSCHARLLSSTLLYFSSTHAIVGFQAAYDADSAMLIFLLSRSFSYADAAIIGSFYFLLSEEFSESVLYDMRHFRFPSFFFSRVSRLQAYAMLLMPCHGSREYASSKKERSSPQITPAYFAAILIAAAYHFPARSIRCRDARDSAAAARFRLRLYWFSRLTPARRLTPPDSRLRHEHECHERS